MHYVWLLFEDIEVFVEDFLNKNMPQVDAWQYDPSNLFEGMSINLYHVHVYFREPIKQDL